MTSAILVLKYMPDMCLNCPLYDFNNRGEPICNKENKRIDSSYGKPNWCPLKKVPDEEKEVTLWTNMKIVGQMDLII